MLSISIVVVTTWKLLWWFTVYLPTGITYNPTVSMCIILYGPYTQTTISIQEVKSMLYWQKLHVIPTFASAVYITGGHHVGSGGLVVGRVLSLPTSQILTLGDQEIQHRQQLTTKQKKSFRVRIRSSREPWWVTSQWKEVTVKDHVLSITRFPYQSNITFFNFITMK